MGKGQEINYHGIDQSDLIKSIKQAVLMISSLNLGPANGAILDEWRQNKPYEKIKSAVSDKDLARVMEETGTSGLFRRMSEIFYFHAAQNTFGNGLKIARDIAAWGAFSGYETADYRPADAENDRYLVKEYAVLSLAAGNKALARADDLIKNLEKYEPEQAEGYEGARDNILLMLSNENVNDSLSQIDQAFQDSDLRGRHLMKEVLSFMSNQAFEQDGLDLPGPISTYGVVFDEIPEKCNFGEMSKIIGNAREKMDLALDPFYETNEVLMSAMGVITEDGKSSGLVFRASRKAAEAVAKAFPDRKVVDYLGNVIGDDKGPDYNGPDTPAP